MQKQSIAMTIRAKKLGVLIRDARLSTRKTLEECAEAVGVDPTAFEAYEMGEASPSLPELEVMSYYLGIPLEHFWGNKAISEEPAPAMNLDLEQLIGLRQRMVGALLRQARQEAGLSLDDVAESAGITPGNLEASEMGEAELPVPLLEAVIAQVGRPVDEFFDQHGPVGTWAGQRQSTHEFLGLPAELQAFVSKPINRPYLELAQRLSEMSVDKLRAVGEGILEITL